MDYFRSRMDFSDQRIANDASIYSILPCNILLKAIIHIVNLGAIYIIGNSANWSIGYF